MRKLLLAGLLLCGLATAQNQHAWNCFPEATLTDDAYWAAQPPAVRALRTDDSTKAFADAQALAAQGYKIDLPIMVWNWDPVCTMGLRQSSGYTWVPAADQAPVLVAPGVNFPGLPSYDAVNAPPGSIKVSTDIKDYPPYPDPKPLPPAPAGPRVGQCYPTASGATQCNLGPASNLQNTTDGQIVGQDGKLYQAHIVRNPFGAVLFFQLVN